MNTLATVSKELLHFALIEWFGFRSPGADIALLRRVILPARLESPSDSLATDKSKVEYKATRSVTVTAPMAHLFRSPVTDFDSVIGLIYGGTTVSIKDKHYRWYQVKHEEKIGWILADTVSIEQPNPEFKIGEQYPANDPETKKLRTLIKDDFSGDLVAAPLQDVEYVTYRLDEVNKKINWPADRPRLAGRWQRILRGQAGVYIGVEPKAGAVMELVHDDDTGHVAYVEEVLEDESIIISEVGWPEESRYSERTLLKEEWREWHPIFISIE